MDWSLVFQIVAAALTVLGIFIAGFWRMWGLIKDVRSEANLRGEAAVALAHTTERALAEHRLHVAETYLTKAGMREFTDQIMESIGSLGAQMTEMRGRIDRVLERPAARTTTGRS